VGGDYRKLSAAAKAGLEPAAQAAAKTVLSLDDLDKNLSKGIARVGAWEADLTKLAARAGGKFAPLAADLAKLGPDAAAAVHEAVGSSDSRLGGLQGKFTKAGKLISDSTIEGLETSILSPVGTLGGTAADTFWGRVEGGVAEVHQGRHRLDQTVPHRRRAGHVADRGGGVPRDRRDDGGGTTCDPRDDIGPAGPLRVAGRRPAADQRAWVHVGGRVTGADDDPRPSRRRRTVPPDRH
jgi:hypothetical protein